MHLSTLRANSGRRRVAGRSGTTSRAAAASGLLLTLVAVAGGCAGDLRQSAVEATTRDWFATLRAAQVLPVYPLTEDLEPGDVFLVTLPIQRQHEVYERDGYVPLDMMGPRLDVPAPGYADFYGDRYWRGRFGAGPFERPTDRGEPVPAPRVVFPRLEVRVESAGGLAVGLPLQSIPIGLELLDVASARVVVDLQDAFTYALPGDALLGELQAWARRPEVRDTLGELAVASPAPVYLRCVTRVFLVRRVTVGIHAVRTSGRTGRAGDTGASLGATGPEAYAERVEGLNRALAAAAPTAAVRLRQAIGSSVLLEEDLGTPVVIGYLGFDVPVRRSGDIGSPVATLQAISAPELVPADVGTSERTIEERLLRVALLDLDAETAARPGRAATITAAVARGLGEPRLAEAAVVVANAGDDPDAVAAAVARFARAVRRFVAEDAGEQARERRTRRLIDAALADDGS